jgi:ubiquinone/menaquinone biosynthesis C-methylase UbiE
MLSQARRRLGQRATFQQTSLGTLPFPDHGFDAALALNLLYFCDEAGTMVADLKRVLRPGGRLMVYVTDRASMEAWPFVRHGTHRLFDETALVEALVAGGFVADRICVHACRVTRRVRGLLAYAEA